MEGKYIVIKTEELDALINTATGYGEHDTVSVLRGITNMALEDAVVIRRQDVFSPPALDAYANSIRVVIETTASLDDTDPEKIERLTNIADYFHEQAVLAWDTNRKLPD